MLKTVWDLSDNGNIKSGVSHKWFDDPSRLIEWFLNAGSDWIIFGLTTNLLCSCSCQEWCFTSSAHRKCLEPGFPKCF